MNRKQRAGLAAAMLPLRHRGARSVKSSAGRRDGLRDPSAEESSFDPQAAIARQEHATDETRHIEFPQDAEALIVVEVELYAPVAPRLQAP